MPAGPGETHLVTLFADVHYYFSDPSAKPLHHRFSRASYLYLFHNAIQRRTRLQIANHAGTPDQDAFAGFLDSCRLTYSYKQPSLCTLTVDTAQQLPQDEWHLPGLDINNEQKHTYRLHTLDIYLWTEKDAATLLGHLKATIPDDLQDIRHAPSSVTQQPSDNRLSISPVVQQLEQTAISSNFPPRAESVASVSSLPGAPAPVAAPAPAPYNPAAPAAPEPIRHREKTPPPPDGAGGLGFSHNRYDSISQTQYATVPNTFGPASTQNTPRQAFFPGQQPQPQQHHAHTSSMSFPGPPAGTPPSTGYARTASNNFPGPPPRTGSGTQFQQGMPQQQTPPSFAPPPAQAQSPPSFAPPPSQPQNLASFAPPPTSASPGTQPPFNRQATSSSMPDQPSAQYANYTPSFVPGGMTSPGMPPSTGPYQPHQQQQQYNPTPSAPPAYSQPLASPPPTQATFSQVPQERPAQQQIFTYGTYSYSSPGNQGQGQHTYGAGGGYTGDVHSQAYRPTEAEALAGGYSAPKLKRADGSSDGRGKMEQRVDAVEKKVGGFLKKLDKMW